MNLQAKIDDAYLRLSSAKTPAMRRQALKEMESLLAKRAADPEQVVQLERKRGLSGVCSQPQKTLF